MQGNNIPTVDLINKYKGEFQKLTPVRCTAIGDRVYFNMWGFKHLIFKGKHRRPTKVIVNRLLLIPLIIPTLKKAPEILETRIRKEMLSGKKTEVTYHALEASVGKGSTRVRVVIRKIGIHGKYYFFSIMKY